MRFMFSPKRLAELWKALLDVTCFWNILERANRRTDAAVRGTISGTLIKMRCALSRILA